MCAPEGPEGVIAADAIGRASVRAGALVGALVRSRESKLSKSGARRPSTAHGSVVEISVWFGVVD